MSMSEILYVIEQAHGIYEILRVDGTQHYVVVQTNIRTREKAEEACRRWQEREINQRLETLNNMILKLQANEIT